MQNVFWKQFWYKIDLHTVLLLLHRESELVNFYFVHGVLLKSRTGKILILVTTL